MADAFDRWIQAMKILICDRQRMLAEALASALDARGYNVLAVTTAVSDALSAVGDCVPDVCLLGLPPGHQSGGLDAIRAILQRYPGTKVLVLSEVTHRGALSHLMSTETLPHLMRSGVLGITHQDQSVAQIAAALDAIEAGRNVLEPGTPQVPARGAKRLYELSPRETEILARIAGGQSTRQMSCAMNITVDTVRTYVRNVLVKLGAHSRLQLAALAARDSLLADQAANFSAGACHRSSLSGVGVATHAGVPFGLVIGEAAGSKCAVNRIEAVGRQPGVRCAGASWGHPGRRRRDRLLGFETCPRASVHDRGNRCHRRGPAVRADW
jgi:two-component system, NarL family, nitrate/nitrite response regulator NarL